jgi:hypothetical protein
MKSLATIFALAALAAPAAAFAGGSQPMSDVQLSRLVTASRPLSDVQLSRPSISHGSVVSPTPVSDVQLSRYGSRSAAPVLSTPGGGFNWADASIGAAVAFGAVLLAVAAALAVRNTRGRFQNA